MTKEKQVELVQELDKKGLDIMKSKQVDYADQDVLSNFKRLSEAALALNIDVKTSIGYSLYMALLKIDRINNLVSNNKTPNNESVSDSFSDCLNYVKLAYLCYKEKEEEIENFRPFKKALQEELNKKHELFTAKLVE